jgi:hypothetical protein
MEIVRGPVVPQLNCWEPDPATPGNIKAVFGYDNRNAFNVTLAAGISGNAISPEPANRGQPATFMPGVTSLAFSVSYPESQGLTWTVDIAVNVDISDAASRCPQGPF